MTNEQLHAIAELINSTDANEYKLEVASGAAVHYAQKLGPEDPIVSELLRVASVCTLMRDIWDVRHAEADWVAARNALPFFKRLRVSKVMPESYLDEWRQDQRFSALMDLSAVLAEE